MTHPTLPEPPAADAHLSELNVAQRAAVTHGCDRPAPSPIALDAPGLLIIAGAGAGKTKTLAHRVAHLIACGADPRRILLLTFTRRAAQEMTRRAQRIVGRSRRDAGADAREPSSLPWSGTFHAIGNRLLRMHAENVGLDPSFTVLDRSDSADLLNLLRSDLGLAKQQRRFPQKGTCLAIYSHVVNAQCSLDDALARAFPWCESWADALRELFAAYVEAKQRQAVLDFDDLLLYWHALMGEPALAEQVASRFDHVLVDEYQDTNALQAEILRALRPHGNGLTVVGDDAQSIYSFRAARVRNILDFPGQFDPPARVVTLERNYRSTAPILAACNALMAEAKEGYPKRLHCERRSEERPILATVEDEASQVDYVAERILEHREAGIPLIRQAVLFRTSHHSDALEVELGRREIPFVKFGGLKFLEAAHVKDVICILRWIENPRDAVAGFRTTQLLAGIGPGHAHRILEHLGRHRFDLGCLAAYEVPAAARADWQPLCALLRALSAPDTPWPGQLEAVQRWYAPQLERIYDAPHVRAGDLEQLEQLSSGYASRERFLSELALDPPAASGDEAGPPHLDEDYLVLSTIHSAKGQEWDVVYVLNAADGCIPSDMATGHPEQIEEERRLLYVAMTRARDHLHVVHPLRFYVRQQHRHGSRHVFTPRSRFLTQSVVDCFARHGHAQAEGGAAASRQRGPRVDVAARLRAQWSTR